MVDPLATSARVAPGFQLGAGSIVGRAGDGDHVHAPEGRRVAEHGGAKRLGFLRDLPPDVSEAEDQPFGAPNLVGWDDGLVDRLPCCWCC